MQTELKNGFDKDKVIAELRALLQPPSTLGQPLSLPPASTQPPTDQRTSADKSLSQIKQFFRDRSPEISEPMIVSDSESSDSDEESVIQFTPNQSKQASKEKAKRKSRGVAKGVVKSLMDAVFANPKPWNCDICSDSFPTLELFRQHVSVKHKGRNMCNRCPYIGGSPFNMKKHEQSHAANGVNVKNPDCKLCHVQFANNGHLVKHLRRFHLPKDSK